MDSNTYKARPTAQVGGAGKSGIAGITNTVVPVDYQRIQAYKGAMTKFYLHKSFDSSSDMEFLPAIPSEAGAISGTQALSPPLLTTPIASPSFQYNRLNDYYNSAKNNGNRRFSSGSSNYDAGANTPKTRMAYLSQSPKRTPPNPTNMRKRVVSGMQQQAQYGTNSHDYNTIDQNYMIQNRINQYSNRNW